MIVWHQSMVVLLMAGTPIRSCVSHRLVVAGVNLRQVRRKPRSST